MRISSAVMVSAVSFCALLQGQQQPAMSRAPHTPYYIDPVALNVGLLLPEPPATDSPTTRAELAELHRIQDARTPEQIAQAKADDAEEDIFVYKSILGPGFTPEALPLTAALGAHVKNEESVVGGIIKRSFQRPRPYQIDSSLHPVCPAKSQNDSYPSGHSLSGYLEAFTLAELLPARRTEILARADEYAHNRTVCGVHYPSDVEASRRVAYAVMGYLLATPKFQHDLEESRHELESKLSSQCPQCGATPTKATGQ